MLKKMISLLLLTSFCITLSVYAEEENDLYTDGIFEYETRGTQVTITGVSDSQSVVTVPETIDGHSVTKIAKGAFSGLSEVQKIILPDTVTDIGDMCFAYSSSIQSVRLSGSISKINDGLFYQCPSLIGVTIPKGVTSIASKAFGMCENLCSVSIPDTVNEIAEDAFSGSGNVKFYCNISESCPAYYWGLSRGIECEQLVTVILNGKLVDFDQAPVTEQKKFRTLVPLRSVLEDMGADIEWYPDMEYAGITINGHRILIKAGFDFMRHNEKTEFLSCPPMEVNGRLVIPIRDVVKAVGGKVDWDENSHTAIIVYNK